MLRRLSAKPLPEWDAEIEWAQLLLKFVVSPPAIPGTAPLHDNRNAAYGKLPDEKLRKDCERCYIEKKR